MSVYTFNLTLCKKNYKRFLLRHKNCRPATRFGAKSGIKIKKSVPGSGLVMMLAYMVFLWGGGVKVETRKDWIGGKGGKRVRERGRKERGCVRGGSSGS
jgi:hypothetical protein